MPCRVSRAPALSIHITSDCLWTIDDILSDAFNRFLRPSHAHGHRQHASKDGRRYGSNVPGPLEARRRLARRRMGVVTNAGAAGPPDLGALFGLNARPPVDWETSWNWQPPTIMSGHPPPPLPAAAKDKWLTELLPWTQRQKRAHVVPDRTLRASDLVDRSRSNFERLLEPLHRLGRIDLAHLEPILDYLQSTQDEPRAENLRTLRQYIEPRGHLLDPKAFRALCRLLLDKVKLRTVPDEQIAPFLRLLTYRGAEDNDRTVIAALVVMFDTMSIKSWTMAAIRDLLQGSKGASGQIIPAAAVRFLLTALDASDRFKQLPRTGKIWKMFYIPLAESMEPTQLVDHFKRMNEKEMAQVLCRFWLSRYMHMKPVKAQFLLQGSWKVMTFPASCPGKHRTDPRQLWEEFQAAHPEPRRVSCLVESEAEQAKVEQKWEGFAGAEEELPTTPPVAGTGSPPCQPLVDLLALLANHNISYTALMSDMFEIIQMTRTSEELYELFRHISLHPDLGIPESIAMHRISYFMRPSADAEELTRAFYVFKNMPSLSMFQCIDLPLRLIEKGAGYPSFVFDILARRNGHSDVPINDRQRRKLTLSPEAIDMAHLVAFAYASQEGSIRTAFARVWETYRFLQDRGAPLTPLMSRALVKAGVLRYLKERKKVPLPQLRYVLSLVHRLEGAEVAATLDRLAFEVWSQKLDLNDPSLPGGGGRGVTRLDQGTQMATMWRYMRYTRWAIKTSKALRKKQQQRLHEMVENNAMTGPLKDQTSSREMLRGDRAGDFEPMVTPREVEGDTIEQARWRTAVDADMSDESAGIYPHGEV